MLQVDNVSMSFGGVKALSDFSLQIPAGSVVGLAGPNGSGKSTLLNAISGFVAATGSVEVDGHKLRLRDPRAARRAGIMRTFQTPQLIDTITCLENVLIADGDRRGTGLTAACVGRPWMLGREKQRWQRAATALDNVGLGHRATDRTSVITFGERRRLELARAVVATPKVVLLDEPTAGLNDAETAEFGKLLASLLSESVAVVIVDHKIDFLDSLCDKIVVLEQGRMIAQGSAKDVWADERVIEAYLGADHAVA